MGEGVEKDEEEASKCYFRYRFCKRRRRRRRRMRRSRRTEEEKD